MIKINPMVSPRSGNAVPNQYILSNVPAGSFFDGQERLPSGTAFQSYRTLIAYIDCTGAVYLDKYAWDYSRTTSKYRNAFLGMDTAEVKKGIKDGSIKLAELN